MGRFIGVDVGGTFTDVVIVDGETIDSRKVPTSSDQSTAVAGSVEWRADDTFYHGTTAATNTLLEGTGAHVGLVTDPGFEDMIEIARQDRPSLYDTFASRPEPLVDRSDRVSRLEDLEDVDIVAISLMNAFADPTVERRLAQLTTKPTVLSSEVSPEFREYERLATTVLSAYLTPSVAGYVGNLDERLTLATKLIMTSSGGLIPFAEASRLAARLVLSGPAGGVVAAAALGRYHGYDSVLTFDMGGTSTDVSRIVNGTPQVGTGHKVGGRVNRVPSVPVHTIGAGGGSVAWADSGGALRVGPRSSGADPGPAVYGKGGKEVTVTDANVLAGNLPPDLALGGSLQLDFTAGRRAAATLAEQLGMKLSGVVEGVLEVVDAHMERALRAVSVEEGADPRESVLVAFGGAGGLHASRLARRLGVARTLIPPHSGVFSALGLLMATPSADVVRTVLLDQGESLDLLKNELRTEVTGRYRRMFSSSPNAVDLGADVRYPGQSHEIRVALRGGWDALASDFHQAHLEQFGFDRQDQGVELVNISAVAEGRPRVTWADLPDGPSGGEPGPGPVWSRNSLAVGASVIGPGVVVEDNSATLLEEGDILTVLGDGTLEVTR